MDRSPAVTFEQLVDAFVIEAVKNGPPESLDDLVVRLPGVYPTEAVAAVDRLGQRGGLDPVTTARLRQRSARRQPTPLKPNPLPVPHPLDYDWRFSPSAVERLVGESQARSGGTRPVLLGAPSVFWGLRAVQVPALLLDANPSVIEVLSAAGGVADDARLCDLRCDGIPDEQSSVVVVDPPWYREHEHLFLWAAAQLCRPGGSVLVSMPGMGTRPGVRAEREDALAWAEQLGFDVETIEQGALGYVSPPFERNALAAVGLDGMPDEWRHGDLVTLRLRTKTEAPRPECAMAFRWPEVVIGSVRIRVRSGQPGPESSFDPRLLQLVPGDVLDTVSRRDPRRDRVAMWTSGNRVFATRSPEALLEVVRGVADGIDASDRVEEIARRRLTTAEQRHVRSAQRQVSAVVDAERAELIAMGWAA